MIKHFAAAGLLLGLSLAAAPPAAAADCGVLALVSPCGPAPQPAPQPVPVPVPLLESAPAPAPSSAPVPAAPAPQPPPAAPAPVARQKMLVPAAAERMHQLVNQERARAALPALATSPRIASIAAGHSMAMADRRDIWHNDAFFGAANRRALGARALGENVAMNGSIEEAHRRLMASPGHRANILKADFDAVGVAVVQDESGMLYVTQGFADWSGEPGPAPAGRPAPPKAAAKPAAPARPGGSDVVLRPASVAPAPAAPVPPAAPSLVPGFSAAAPGVAVAAGPGAAADGPGRPLVALTALALLAAVAFAVTRLVLPR